MFALNQNFMLMAILPRTEIVASTLVIMGFFYYERNKPVAYVCGFLGSLVRYEAAALIPALVVMDLLKEKNKIMPFVYGFLASSGLIGWLLLNYLHTGHLNPYFMHYDEKVSSSGFSYFDAVFGNLFEYLPFISVIKVLFFSAIFAGFYYLFKNKKLLALGILVFYIQDTCINFSFFTSTHVSMTLWVYFLLLGACIKWVIDIVLSKNRIQQTEKRKDHVLLSVIGFTLVVFVLHLIFNGLFKKELLPFAILLEMYFICMVSFLFFRTVQSKQLIILILISSPLVFGYTNKQVAVTGRVLHHYKYNKADMRAIAEWYQQHGKSEKIIVTDVITPGFFLSDDKKMNLVALNKIEVSTVDQLALFMKQHNIKYITWDMAHGNYEKGSYGYKRYRIDLIDHLQDAQSGKDFEYITSVGSGDKKGHIYKLKEGFYSSEDVQN
jgi:hypothetical protein